MNTASLELSKELYEVSGWDNGWYSYWGRGVVARDSTEQRICPAYDLGYLIRKFKGYGGIEIRYGDTGCIATSHVWSIESDTPEDAVSLLAIELFKQGILKR